MKVLILGATGPTGGHVLTNTLESGDTVTVLARRPEALAAAEGSITVLRGRGRSLSPEGLFTGAAGAVVEAMNRCGAKRLVWLSSFGVGETIKTASLPQRAMYRIILRRIYADKAASERILRNSGLDWTIVYPTTLTNDPARGSYRAAESIIMKGMPRISRADVGAFMHKAAHDPEWIRRDAVITD